MRQGLTNLGEIASLRHGGSNQESGFWRHGLDGGRAALPPCEEVLDFGSSNQGPYCLEYRDFVEEVGF